MKKSCCLLIALSLAYGLMAQTTPLLVNDNDEDLVARIFGKDKLTLLLNILEISPVEAAAFQSALADYENEKGPWLKERNALLKMYNEEFSSLDEKKLNSLTKQIMNNDLEFDHLQLHYFRRMNKLLGATQTAKFFQLDSYLEQATRMFIQNQLPFINKLESDRQSYMHVEKPLTVQ